MADLFSTVSNCGAERPGRSVSTLSGVGAAALIPAALTTPIDSVGACSGVCAHSQWEGMTVADGAPDSTAAGHYDLRNDSGEPQQSTAEMDASTTSSEGDTTAMTATTPSSHKKVLETARKAAESLAQEAIATRVALVGAIGEAEAELAAIDAARVEAEDTIRVAHERAIAGGWTVKELAAMGYSAPKKKKAAASSKRSSSAPAVNTAAANAPQSSEQNSAHDSSA